MTKRQKEYAQDLRARREALGLTRHQFADLVGVAENTVYLWETGKAEPHHIIAERIEDVLKAQGGGT